MQVSLSQMARLMWWYLRLNCSLKRILYLHWRRWLPENLCMFCRALLWGVRGCGRVMGTLPHTEIWEGNWDVLGGLRYPSEGKKTNWNCYASRQAHLGLLLPPLTVNALHSSCLTSGRSAPHKTRWVTWNKIRIPTCREKTKGRAKAENRAWPQRPLGYAMNQWRDSQDSGMPQLTENIHSGSSLAGPRLELRKVWRTVRVLRLLIKAHAIHRLDCIRSRGKQPALSTYCIHHQPYLSLFYSQSQAMGLQNSCCGTNNYPGPLSKCSGTGWVTNPLAKGHECQKGKKGHSLPVPGMKLSNTCLELIICQVHV